MSDKRRYPLHVRRAGKQAEYDAPVEGVPPWLKQSLFDWLNRNFLSEQFAGTGIPKFDVIQRIERTLRVTLDWSIAGVGVIFSVQRLCDQDSEFFLSVLDLALQDFDGSMAKANAIDHLDNMLKEGGSEWMVAPDRRGLVKRVEPEVVEAARGVIQSWPRPGHHLGEAWRKIFGREPDPSGGYREAVRAVEAAARPIVVPNDTTATLGKIIGTLRSEAEKFKTVFGSDLPDFKALDAVRDLMSLVWKYQRDRHGTDDETVPLHVSPEQAEAALFAAVTLVHWFQRGFVRAAGA
jgi:hypothetical protein